MIAEIGMIIIGNAAYILYRIAMSVASICNKPSSRFSHIVATIAHNSRIIKMPEVPKVGSRKRFAVI